MAQHNPLDAVLALFSTAYQKSEFREFQSSSSSKPLEQKDIVGTPTAKSGTLEQDESSSWNSWNSIKTPAKSGEFQKKCIQLQRISEGWNSRTLGTLKNEEGPKNAPKNEATPNASPIGPAVNAASPATESEASLDPAAIETRAAELLAEAGRHPAVRITDPDKAIQHFRERAMTEAHKEPPNVAGMRSPSWADPGDMPRPGDRCNRCRGGTWWTEASEARGWRCNRCHPAPHPFQRTVRT